MREMFAFNFQFFWFIYWVLFAFLWCVWRWFHSVWLYEKSIGKNYWNWILCLPCLLCLSSYVYTCVLQLLYQEFAIGLNILVSVSYVYDWLGWFVRSYTLNPRRSLGYCVYTFFSPYTFPSALISAVNIIYIVKRRNPEHKNHFPHYFPWFVP